MTQGASAIENLSQVTHIVMDKTGTLTEGMPQVSNFKISSIWEERMNILATYICAAEENGASAHPVGGAIFKETLRTAGGRWHKYKEFGGVRNLEEIPGSGITCEVDAGDAHWRQICVGNLALLKNSGVTGLDGMLSSSSTSAEIDALGTLAFAAIDGGLAAIFLLQVGKNGQIYSCRGSHIC